MQLGGEAVAGVLEVHVGGAHRRHALAATRAPPTASRCRSARTSTSGPSPRRRRIRARRRRTRPRRRPGRRRAGPGTSSAPSPEGRTEPVIQLTCEQATSLVRGPTASARSANGTARMSTPRRVAQRGQRPEQAGVLVGRGEHLVAGPELQPGQHAHDAVARARRQGDVGHVGAEHARVRRALAVAQLDQRVDVLLRAPQPRRRGRASRGSRARTRAAAARTCRRSGRPGPRGPGTRRAGRRHPRAAGYVLPAADRPGRRAGARVEHGRAAILLGLGRRGRVAAAADARPGAVVELVLAAERAAAADGARVAARLARGDRLQHAGDRRRRARRRSGAARGCRRAARGARDAGAPATTPARGARTRGARGGGPGEPCAAPGAGPRARPGAWPAPRRSGCAARAGWGWGQGPRRRVPRRQGRRSRRTRRRRPTASWASSSKSRPTGAARERAQCARDSALSGSSEREPCRGDLLHESAGARPAQRHGAVGYQAPCDPARAHKVAARHERSFASAPNRRLQDGARVASGAMKVTLPDGTPLELPDGATGADAAAAIGPGLARAALAVKQNGAAARPRAAAGGRRAAGDRHRSQRPGRARPHPPRRRPRARRGGDGALPGREDLDRPADRERLLLRLRLPRRRQRSPTPTSRRIEAKMREHIAADEPFEREDVPVDAGARALPRARARTTRSSSSRTWSERPTASTPSRSTPTARSPTSAAARTRRARSASARSSCSRSPAPTGAATPTARCSRASTARPSSSRPSSTRTSSSSSRRGRATTASSAASSGCSPSPRSRRARRSGCRRAPRCSTRSSRSTARMQQERGYVEVKTPQLYESQPLGDLRPLGQVQGEHLRRRVRGPRVRPQADELPGPLRTCSGCSTGPTATCRCRCAEPGLLHRREPSGTLHGLLRVRHFIQDDAHIFCTEDQIQDEVAQLPGLRLRRSTALFGFQVHAELSTRPDEPPRRRRALGPRRGRARQGARAQRPSSTRSARARAPSTARRSTCT